EVQYLDKPGEHTAELRVAKLCDELLRELVVGHKGFGHNDVRPTDLRALGADDAEVAVHLLCAHPDSELGDLRAPRVDVHAVEIVSEDQARDGLSKRVEARVVVRERFARRLALWTLGVAIGFLVDRE